MQLSMIQVETFRESFSSVLRFLFVGHLVGFLLFSEVEKLLKTLLRSRIRNQCKEIFQVPERKVVKCHGEKDETQGKKADLTSTAKLCRSHSPRLENHVMLSHPQKSCPTEVQLTS